MKKKTKKQKNKKKSKKKKEKKTTDELHRIRYKRYTSTDRETRMNKLWKGLFRKG